MKKNLAILIAFLGICFCGFGVFGNDEKILQNKIKNKLLINFFITVIRSDFIK